jgi:DNA-binding transcriptional MerR regulator
MEHRHNPPGEEDELPPIPAKRYFTIGEVSELCGVKPHVLRYWEQEFTQLKSVVKRRGNRRYYQHHEVLLVRRIRELLYSQCFTISGARNRLEEELLQAAAQAAGEVEKKPLSLAGIRAELKALLELLGGAREIAPAANAVNVAADVANTTADVAAKAPNAPAGAGSAPVPEAAPESAPITPELFPALDFSSPGKDEKNETGKSGKIAGKTAGKADKAA